MTTSTAPPSSPWPACINALKVVGQEEGGRQGRRLRRRRCCHLHRQAAAVRWRTRTSSICDRKGAIYAGRDGLNSDQGRDGPDHQPGRRRPARWPTCSWAPTCSSAFPLPACVTTEMVKTMNREADHLRLREPDAGDLPGRGQGGRRRGRRHRPQRLSRTRSTTFWRSPASSAVRSTFAPATSTRK